MPLTKSSFAGQSDIVTLLAVLKTLHSADCLPAVWYQHSRGSGTAMAVIGILNQPTSEEKKLLLEWKINEKVRCDIVNAIKIIYLLNPLTNFDIALNKQLQTRLGFIDYLLPVLRTKVVAPALKHYILPFLTRYDPAQKNPIDYVEQWNDIQAKVWLHFEENDSDVSNEDDVNLSLQLLSCIGNNLYVSRTNNGGHNAYPKLMNRVVEEFNKKNECSYCWGSIDKWVELIIDNAHMSIENSNKDGIEKHLDNFSKKHTQQSFWQHRMTKRLVCMSKILLTGLLLYYLNKSPYGILGIRFTMTMHFLLYTKHNILNSSYSNGYQVL